VRERWKEAERDREKKNKREKVERERFGETNGGRER
jgi:hypothetical protein